MTDENGVRCEIKIINQSKTELTRKTSLSVTPRTTNSTLELTWTASEKSAINCLNYGTAVSEQ
jgi:hypothetical protein